MIVLACPIHGMTAHTEPPSSKYGKPWCLRCLAVAYARKPGQFALTPAMQETLRAIACADAERRAT